MRQDDPLAGIDVESPVQAEVFVLCLRQGTIELTGPCGPAPWYIETTPDEHPVEVVHRLVADVIGDAELIHSTSWRQGRDGIILSFFVIINSELADTMQSSPIGRAPAGPIRRLGGACRD